MRLLFVVLCSLMSDSVFKAVKKWSKASSLPPSLHNNIKDALQEVSEHDLADQTEISRFKQTSEYIENYSV
ncbi:MAG: hypothetical protein H0U50_06465 [Pyrinomonadaceae bacterium]|nr:hypothetical protein [Pyrinomonadaceae bacterium]